MKRTHLLLYLEDTLAALQAIAAANLLVPGKIYRATDTEELYRPKTSSVLGSGFTEAGGGGGPLTVIDLIGIEGNAPPSPSANNAKLYYRNFIEAGYKITQLCSLDEDGVETIYKSRKIEI